MKTRRTRFGSSENSNEHEPLPLPSFHGHHRDAIATPHLRSTDGVERGHKPQVGAPPSMPARTSRRDNSLTNTSTFWDLLGFVVITAPPFFGHSPPSSHRDERTRQSSLINISADYKVRKYFWRTTRRHVALIAMWQKTAHARAASGASSAIVEF